MLKQGGGGKGDWEREGGREEGKGKEIQESKKGRKRKGKKKYGNDLPFEGKINKRKQILTAFLGVGGWSEIGIDPAQYSRALMEGARNLCENNIQKNHAHDPKAIMLAGWQHASKTIGSSTCCICVLDGLKLVSII